ncbi:MAG: hypothetical protein MRY57_04225 [Candidatus Pacebacteria bacterium]|nr:hypothetical protein [Candidatus Paceibacterota bacterium]
MFEKVIINKQEDTIEATKVEQETMPELTGKDLEDFKEIEALLAEDNTEVFNNAIKKEGMRAKLRKAVLLGMTLLAPAIAKANTAEHTPKGNDINKEISFDAQATEKDVDTISFEEAQQNMNETEPDPEDNNENGLEDGVEKFEKTFDAGFDMGKADLSPEQIIELKSEFIEFLNELPEEVKERINSGEAKIVIEGSTSYHVIDPEVGTDSGSRGQVFDNETLAQYRADEGVKAMQDNVLDSVDGIDSAAMETSTRQYTQEDADGIIEEGRRLRISIEEMIERNPASAVEDIPEFVQDAIEKNPKLKTFVDADMVIIDQSGSMVEDAKAVYNFVNDLEQELGKEISKKGLLGGNAEAHTKTIERYLSDVEDNSKIVIITDEPDFSFKEIWSDDAEARNAARSEQTKFSNNLVETLNERGIKVVIQVLNPDQSVGGYKEVSLNENPEIMIALDKGEYKDGRAMSRSWFDGLPAEHIDAKEK